MSQLDSPPRLVSAGERLRHWLLSQTWFASYLLPILPRRLRWGLRWVYLSSLDLIEYLTGVRDPSQPPRSANFTGAVSDLEASGKAYREVLIEVACLTPGSQVLDVGCGFSRLGAALTGWLNDDGSYGGIDIVPSAIEWCRARFANYDNFHFTHADIHNREYNPAGTVNAVDYRFPYGDETLDLVVLTSVFTHMLPTEVAHYLDEIARILRPNGRCYATFSLLTPESLRLMSSKSSRLDFKYDCGNYRVVSQKVPELAVAYDEKFMRKLYDDRGMSTVFYAGHWCGQTSHWGRDPHKGLQDVLVGTKIPPASV
jgi:SAM-dependent methyltransferase